MLQFVEGGPEIPQEVLEALEDKWLVLFCGAGISVYTGLPTFKGLVEEVIRRARVSLNSIETKYLNDEKYDKVLGLLEGRTIPHQVRLSTIDVLSRPSPVPLATHRSLLELARVDGGVRLVTTNFDNRFLESGELKATQVSSAPALPSPKGYAWRTLVHLHGRICDDYPDGKNLVLTAADFGCAYLTEAWAARFVVELFRGFTVLFIGYGVNDPVMSYLVDALAAERSRHQPFQPAFALAAFGEQPREEAQQEWQAKGIEPILYDEAANHEKLHSTLAAWATLKAGGLTSRKRVALDEGSKPATPPDSGAARRLVWALSEETGQVALAFAQQEPPPSLTWLGPLEKTKFRDRLTRTDGCSVLGLPPQGNSDQGVTVVQSSGPATEPLRPATRSLCLWLACQIGEPNFLRWVLEHGALLHPELGWLIAQQLGLRAALIPHGLRVCWEILTSQRYREARSYPRLGGVSLRADAALESQGVRDWVLQMLRPVPVLTPAMQLPDLGSRESFDPARVRDLVSFDVTFAGEHVATTLRLELQRHPGYSGFVGSVAHELTSLLKDCMDWFCQAEAAAPDYDPTYLYRPSVAKHPRNHDVYEWTCLIELVGDSVIALSAEDLGAARALVGRWMRLRYPVFERLVLYAGTERRDLSSPAATVLSRNGRWALWSICTEHEAVDFLRHAPSHLPRRRVEVLERAILDGPPRRLYRDDLPQDELESVTGHSTWLRLDALQAGGMTLTPRARRVLRGLAAEHGRGPAARESFPVRISPARWANEGAEADKLLALPWRDAFAKAFELAMKGGLTWTDCRTIALRHPGLALALVDRLPPVIFVSNQVLQGLIDGLTAHTEARTLRRALSLLHARVLGWEGRVRVAVSGALASVLRHSSEKLPACDKAGERLAGELWDMTWQAGLGVARPGYGDSVSDAINHPAGRLAETILRRIRLDMSPETAEPVVARLTAVAGGPSAAHLLGRAVLATQLAFLYRFNPEFVLTCLVPRFSWDDQEEAKGIWEGFLHSARITPDLIAALRPHFLHAPEHLSLLPKGLRRSYGELVGAVALYLPTALTREEFNLVLNHLDDEVRAAILYFFVQGLKTDTEHAESLWQEVMKPWLAACWPKDQALNGPNVSQEMCELALAGGSAFPDIVDVVSPFVACPGRPGFVIHTLDKESQLPEHHPQATTKLLLQVVPTEGDPRQHYHVYYGLTSIIGRIRGSWPDAETNPGFRELVERCERMGNP